MRIIAGTFRSRQLRPLKRLPIRPTSDMLRETLFNILGPRVQGALFLDLFAGTGAVGIEAVSRGASHVAFVENHRAAARLIRENLALLEVRAGARLISADALAAIAKLEAEHANAFDFIFLDPPYANERDYHSVLHTLERSSLVGDSSIVITEHHKTFSLPVTIGRIQQFRTLKQGDAALSFYRVSP